jgi:MFS family permease
MIGLPGIPLALALAGGLCGWLLGYLSFLLGMDDFGFQWFLAVLLGEAAFLVGFGVDRYLLPQPTPHLDVSFPFFPTLNRWRNEIRRSIRKDGIELHKDYPGLNPAIAFGGLFVGVALVFVLNDANLLNPLWLAVPVLVGSVLLFVFLERKVGLLRLGALSVTFALVLGALFIGFGPQQSLWAWATVSLVILDIGVLLMLAAGGATAD